jgi:DNA ligase (NAD+)
MTKAKVEERINHLRDEIRRHDRLYYTVAQPEITDLEYDRLLKELESLEAANPEFASVDSPTRRVGDAPVPHLEQVAHAVPMLSIDNTYSRDELRAYFRSHRKVARWRTNRLGDGIQDRWRRRINSLRKRRFSRR